VTWLAGFAGTSLLAPNGHGTLPPGDELSAPIGPAGRSERQLGDGHVVTERDRVPIARPRQIPLMGGLLARGRSRTRRPDWALCAPRCRWRDGEVAVVRPRGLVRAAREPAQSAQRGWDDRHMPVTHGRVALVTGSGGSGMRSTCRKGKRSGC
jgi:hypothetical protein